MLDKKGTLTVTAGNPFQTELVFRESLWTKRFAYDTYFYFNDCTQCNTFNYRFGKISTHPTRPSGAF